MQTNQMGQGQIYYDFIEQYKSYPKELFALVASERPYLSQNIEDENYNLGTMQRYKDRNISSNIAIASALSFSRAFNDYKQNNLDMSETEIKARVVFDFLNEYGVNYSYEKNKDDILFADEKGTNITREQFYANAIYINALTNTNFFDNNIGNMQILCLEPKTVSDCPRNLEGLPQENIDRFMNIPDKERLEILYKRGMYHESLHMAMGTTDERKCDAFALLKTMKEHPDYAKTIFEIYNFQRSKMGYTVATLYGKSYISRINAIKGGAMTYLMPNTYKKLEQYALNPQLIPQSDAELLRLTCELTSEPEFTKEQLSAYIGLMKKENITPQDLANNAIVKSCMKQGGFKNIEEYITSDKKLQSIVQNGSEKHYSFEQIISSATEEMMIAPYQSKNKAQIKEDNAQLISPEKQRYYLAFYARAAYEHVNFENFSQENQIKFKSEIEQIFANIKSDRPQGDFLQELGNRTAKYIEDRHFEIGIGEKTFHGGEEKNAPSVGNNFTFAKRKNDYSQYKYQSIGEGYTEMDGQKIPTWSIGTMKKDNEEILVVSIPNLCRPNTYEGWKDFIDTFDKFYSENKEKLDKGRIILDVRGNRGGEDKPIDHIAKRLYGNMLNTYKRCEIKDTALSNYFLHKHGAYKPQNYQRSGLKTEDLIERHNFSGQNKTLFDETEKYYPFNEKTGYKGRIDVLIDRDVASSAESAYTSFYHHPNVRYIGENTAGMQQYTQGTFPTPWGGDMRVAVTKLTYWDKEGENIEVKGHKPDVLCSGKDALEVALTLSVDEGRVIGFREKNEKPSANQVYEEYNPQTVTDARKAYYTIYLEPAIAKIEVQNQIENIRNKNKTSQNTQGTETTSAPTKQTTLCITTLKQIDIHDSK